MRHCYGSRSLEDLLITCLIPVDRPVLTTIFQCNTHIQAPGVIGFELKNVGDNSSAITQVHIVDDASLFVEDKASIKTSGQVHFIKGNRKSKYKLMVSLNQR